jgi:hypothetical protein
LGDIEATIESLWKFSNILEIAFFLWREGCSVKQFLFVIIFLVLAILFWFAFGLWSGIYSVYSVPPSAGDPDGRTLIVSRDEGEPIFNSPQAKIPRPKVEPKGGMGFGSTPRPKRPLDKRTVIELPFVEWAYNQSLESASEEQSAP